MSLAQLFFMKETFREQMRCWRQACFRKRTHAQREQRFTLELLEPRLLLSATPTEVVVSQALEPAAITVPAGSLPSLDVDLNGQADALSDGIMIIRHLFGFTGNALTDGVVDPAGQRTDPTAIQNYLNSISSALDVDLNGGADALSDGIAIIHSLFGFTGTALTNGVVDPAGQRTDPAVIEAFLNNMNPQRELIAPLVTAGLQQDTGVSTTDAITFNPTITGTIADINQIASFTVGFDGAPVVNFVDVLADLQGNGTFSLSAARLAQVAGGTLADGAHTLHLRATDARGNGATLDLSFTLDRTVTGTNVDLAILSDTLPLGDRVTTARTVVLHGTAEAQSHITLVSSSTTVSADGNGNFVIPDVGLTIGPNVLQFQIIDPAGNIALVTQSFTRVDDSTVAVWLQLANDTGVSSADTLTSDAAVMGQVTGPTPVTSLRARLESVLPSGTDPAFQVVSPRSGSIVSPGVTVVQFTIANFVIGSLGGSHVNIYLDKDPTPYRFYNGSTRQILYGGNLSQLISWFNESTVKLVGLSEGVHELRFELVGPDDLPVFTEGAGQAVLLSVAPSSTVSPGAIFDVAAVGVTDYSAIIRWTSTLPADSQVEFGQTSAYGLLTPTDPTLTATHSVTISGLQPDTTYHYRVRSRGQAGVLQASPDFTLRTAVAPFLPGGANITADLQGGLFTLSEVRLRQVYGQDLADGTYRLTVQGEWQPGQLTIPSVLVFTLDRTAPVLTFITLSDGVTVPATLGIIQLQFSEVMVPTDLVPANLRLQNQAGSVLPTATRLSGDGKTVTQYYGTLSTQDHQFLLSGNALHDPAGNAAVMPDNRIEFTVREGGGPLRVDPENTRYFVDGSGAPVYLTGSHTWASFQDQRDPAGMFDYNAYLDFLAQYNHNFFRGWTWESQRADDLGRYASPLPYQRTGPGLAEDGVAKFDLAQFNQDYFDRLRLRVMAAGQRGIYVSIMLFNGWSVNRYDSTRNPWAGHPYNVNNNVNGIDGDINKDGEGGEIHTLAIPQILALQEAYVRKVIDTVNDLDNVLYEISNEDGPSSTDWQYHMIQFIKTYEATKPKQHPVGMTFQYPGGSNAALFASPADWISPNAGDGYGNNPPASTGNKIIIVDTDHLGPVDATWVWKSFLRGLHPILMDWYEVSSPWYSFETVEQLRNDMGYTLSYARRMNLAKALPHGELTSTGYALADPGREYLVYQPRTSSFTVDLRGWTDTFTVEWFNPSSGLALNGPTVIGGTIRTFQAPFTGSAVLYLLKMAPSPVASEQLLPADGTRSGSAVSLVSPSEVVLNPDGTRMTGDSSPQDVLTRLDDWRQQGQFEDFTGEGMTAVVIDTGIDVDHPFFGPDGDHNGVADRIIFQYDFADGDADASDWSGHGSHVASLIGSEDSVYPGLAPDADLIALKVFSDTGTGTFAYVEQALQWVVAHAAEYSIDVVNLSLGDGENWTTPDSHYGLGDEFATLAAEGIIVVAAAGNSFFTAQSLPGVSYPAADPNVIGVGAVWTQDFGGPWRWSSGAIDLTTGPDRIASFSQRDPIMTEIFAPGARLTGANQVGGTVTMQGTSQAAAYLSGTALLAQQVAEEELGRSLTPQEFTELLKVSGKQILDGDDEQDNVLNTGLTFPRVDMVALGEAILALRPEPPCQQWDEHSGLGWEQVLEHRSATGDRHAQEPKFSQPRRGHSDHEDPPRADWDSIGDETAGTMFLAQSYTQQSWVKDFVNPSLVSLDEDADDEVAIVLPIPALI